MPTHAVRVCHEMQVHMTATPPAATVDHHRDKAYEVALVYYQGSLQLHPDSASAYNNLAATHLKLGNHAQAARDAEAALRWEPANVKALLRLAEAQTKLKHYSAAQEVSSSWWAAALGVWDLPQLPAAGISTHPVSHDLTLASSGGTAADTCSVRWGCQHTALQE